MLLTPPPGNPVFQASGLLKLPSGELLTIHDKSPTLHRIEVLPGQSSAELIPLTNCFSASSLARFKTEKTNGYDCEGIAQDAQGRLYICEEADRWILRCDPRTGKTERLDIDWSPVKRFFGPDRNASFEGIAVGDGKLYVANERSSPVIIVVDLANLRVVDSFVAQPLTGSFLGILHYSDLSWHEGRLFVLCRHHRVVLEVDPASHSVLAEYDYREIEERLGYEREYRTGIMEGLAVEADCFWLVTDNNGRGRVRAPKDLRPTLVRCPRPKPE